MATTTTNNGWDIPQSSDYVKLGADAIATLGQDIDTAVGTGLLAWTSWAPTLGNTWANGNGVWNAEYCQLGKIVHVRATFTLGTTTTKGASIPSVSLPVTASTTALPLMASPCPATVAGGSGQLIFPSITTTTTISLYVFNSGGTYLARNNMTNTVPATWATNDVFQLAFSYEAA